ncbi:MAG: hypothetical protein JJV98_02390 [Desulfosarcina sp.]|nr:hypothetical protein [Desulfobacterales bacterium]
MPNNVKALTLFGKRMAAVDAYMGIGMAGRRDSQTISSEYKNDHANSGNGMQVAISLRQMNEVVAGARSPETPGPQKRRQRDFVTVFQHSTLL